MKKGLNQCLVGLGMLVLCTHMASAQWVPTNLPPEDVEALLVNNGNVFAGMNGGAGLLGGVSLSADNGATWTSVNSGLDSSDAFSFLSIIGGKLFAGNLGGVFISANNGTSWDSINYPFKLPLCITTNGNDIFVGTYGNGIFMSADNGTSWKAVDSGLNGLLSEVVWSFTVSGGNIFAGTMSGIFRSANNGTNWVPVDSGLTGTNVHAMAANGSTVFAGTSDAGLYISTNNGTKWTRVKTGLTNDTVTCFAASGGNIFAGTSSGGIFLSTNNGTSWTAVNTGLTDLSITSLAVSDSFLFSGHNNFVTGSGVWRRPISQMAGVINPEWRQGISNQNARGFNIMVGRNCITVSLRDASDNTARTVELFTPAGRRIYSAPQIARSGVLNIPVSGLSKGMYLISVTGVSQTLSSSFVLTK